MRTLARNTNIATASNNFPPSLKKNRFFNPLNKNFVFLVNTYKKENIAEKQSITSFSFVFFHFVKNCFGLLIALWVICNNLVLPLPFVFTGTQNFFATLCNEVINYFAWLKWFLHTATLMLCNCLKYCFALFLLFALFFAPFLFKKLIIRFIILLKV